MGHRELRAGGLARGSVQRPALSHHVRLSEELHQVHHSPLQVRLQDTPTGRGQGDHRESSQDQRLCIQRLSILHEALGWRQTCGPVLQVVLYQSHQVKEKKSLGHRPSGEIPEDESVFQSSLHCHGVCRKLLRGKLHGRNRLPYVRSHSEISLAGTILQTAVSLLQPVFTGISGDKQGKVCLKPDLLQINSIPEVRGFCDVYAGPLRLHERCEDRPGVLRHLPQQRVRARQRGH